MTPLEIAQLTQQSDLLRQALRIQKRVLWRFLRSQVKSREGYYPQGCHTCERCGKETSSTLQSPYNAPHPGWCVECVLYGYWHDLPRYLSPEDLEEQRVWEENNRLWGPPDTPEDYDGPPIVWA